MIRMRPHDPVIACDFGGAGFETCLDIRMRVFVG